MFVLCVVYFTCMLLLLFLRILSYIYIQYDLFLKPPEMARRHHNDSSQMNACLHQDDRSDERDTGRDNKKLEGKHENEKGNDAKPKNDANHRSEGSSQASCSSTCLVPCPAGPSGSAAARPPQSEGNDLMRETTSSCCLLQDLKRLPECDIKLGDLQYSSTHTVLIDVSFSTLNLVILYNKVHLLKILK